MEIKKVYIFAPNGQKGYLKAMPDSIEYLDYLVKEGYLKGFLALMTCDEGE